MNIMVYNYFLGKFRFRLEIRVFSVYSDLMISINLHKTFCNYTGKNQNVMFFIEHKYAKIWDINSDVILRFLSTCMPLYLNLK
jgi:hypothetical protein